MTADRTPAFHLQQIEAFCLTARLGSQTLAGRELGRHPTVVSRQIGAIERVLGTRLVQRTGRGVRLTPAGHKVAACCANALALLAHTHLLAAIHAPDAIGTSAPDLQDSAAGADQPPSPALTDALRTIRSALDQVIDMAEQASPDVVGHALDATMHRLSALHTALIAVSERPDETNVADPSNVVHANAYRMPLSGIPAL